MKLILAWACLCLIIHSATAPPPRRQEHEPAQHHDKNEKDKTGDTGLEDLGIEYERYLREVIDVLESDPEFKRKLEAAEETDIRTGKIAHELEYVGHHVRSKLDEVKRQEMERLRHLAQRAYEISNDIDTAHMKITPPEHLDHENPHTFEIDDLKKLIAKVTSDLNEADKKRREEFKEYEMQKEFENKEKLKHLEGEEKEAFEKQLKDNETKHKQHDPLHHPGSKQQLEEVWEKQDHMGDQEFNPKVFFQLHDLDGNGHWDQDEVKALFLKELDKMYQAGVPEDDMRERAEEMERMREHVFREADRNGDQLISYEEFLEQTKKPEFQKDEGWETIDQQPVYSQQEYAEFERRRAEEIQRMIQQGLIPPQPVYHHQVPYQHHPQAQGFPQGHHPNAQPQVHHPAQYGHQVPAGYPDHGAINAQGHPNQFQQHPGQFQQAHSGQAQQFQGHPGQAQQFQGHPGQAQQFQGHSGQAQQFQGHSGQAQQFQGHSGQTQQFQGHPGQAQQFQAHPEQQQIGQQQPGAQGHGQGDPNDIPRQQFQNIPLPSQGQNVQSSGVSVQPPQGQYQAGEHNALPPQPLQSQYGGKPSPQPPQGQYQGNQPNVQPSQPLYQGSQPSAIPSQGQYQAAQPNAIPQDINPQAAQGQFKVVNPPNLHSNEIPAEKKANLGAAQNLHPNSLGSQSKH